MSNTLVLDSFALVSLLHKEPGWEKARAAEALHLLEQLPIELVGIDRPLEIFPKRTLDLSTRRSKCRLTAAAFDGRIASVKSECLWDRHRRRGTERQI